MGREAECQARVGSDKGLVKALLEVKELILRGAIRGRWALADVREVQMVDDRLRLRVGEDEWVELALGAAQAASWAKKILTPPPSLAAKLGVGPQSRAFVIGPLDHDELVAALEGCITNRPETASLGIAVVLDNQSLTAAIKAHAQLPNIRHLWLVYPKGRDSSLPDSVVREHLRAAGYADSKSTAVSERLTATRYARR